MTQEPLNSDRPQAFARQTSKPRRTALPWIVAVILIAAAAGLYWFNTRAKPAAPVAVAPTTPDAAAQEAAAQAAEEKAAHALTAAGEGTDEKLRHDLGALSPRPEWQQWLAATPDLVESCAVLISNVADDEDPRRRMTPLRPQSDFQVTEEGGHSVESTASEHRYDLPAEVISTLDAHALAPIWHTIHPLIAVAYHAVGRPGVSLDRAAGNALKRITGAQISEQQAPVERVGKLWLYTNPDLEKRGNIEKLLQRMGPANARKLQAKASELRTALALP